MNRHDRIRFGLLLAACAAAGVSAPWTSHAQLPEAPEPAVALFPLDAPPEPFAGALADLKGSDEGKRRAAAAALARADAAEPYLRHYRGTDRGRDDARAKEALDALAERRAERIMRRVPDWAKDGRYDLLVDVSLHLTTDEQADEVGEAFFALANAIRPVPKTFGGPAGMHQCLDINMKSYAKNRMLRRFHKTAGTLETDWIGQAFVRAPSCEASARNRFYWLALTRTELKGVAERSNQWEDCYLFHNGDLTLQGFMTSLAVCDGDVEFTDFGAADMSTVIASGSIRSKSGLGFGLSTLFAGGDIVAPKGSRTTVGLLLAGGKIDVPRTGLAKDSKDRVEKAGVKDNPFGVRFFQPANVGAETATKGGVVTVTKLTPGSPLTKYGMRAGDVVTQVNDKPIKTAQDFRRELRYAVALEAGIFHIRRGDEKLTRVVYFKNGLEK